MSTALFARVPDSALPELRVSVQFGPDKAPRFYTGFPYLIRCPRCDAVRGARCRQKNGKQIRPRGVHKVRVSAEFRLARFMGDRTA